MIGIDAHFDEYRAGNQIIRRDSFSFCIHSKPSKWTIRIDEYSIHVDLDEERTRHIGGANVPDGVHNLIRRINHDIRDDQIRNRRHSDEDRFIGCAAGIACDEMKNRRAVDGDVARADPINLILIEIAQIGILNIPT